MRKNILLIMPRLVQKVGDGYVFPLGLAYVSAALKQDGFSVVTINLNHREGSVSEIIREAIAIHDIHVVGTGGLSPQYHLVKAIIKSVKEVDKSITTVVGGGMISCQPAVAMEALEYADIGVVGEGEITACELMRALESNGRLEDVQGLIFRNSAGRLVASPSRADIADLDSIAWPDYEGFDIEAYLKVPPPAFGGLDAKRTIPMLASRSCPYKCTFCFHTLGAHYRRRSLDDFFAELDYLVNRYEIEYISMADELFEPKANNIRAFCERLKPYGLRWHGDFAVDNVHPELLPLMKEAGLHVMFFGLESADNRILKSMRKGGLTIEKMERTLEVVAENGIQVFGAFIFGDLEETVETAEATMRWWQAHPEYLIHLTMIKPFPGSHIYNVACQQGIIPDPVAYLKQGCPQVNISKMSDQEFSALARRISDAMDDLKKLENVKLEALDRLMGRMIIRGHCSSCGKESRYDEVKLFALHYLTCPHCNQKFHIPLPDLAATNLERNIERLLQWYGRVAVWGITLGVMEMFKHSDVLKVDGIYPVDIAGSKQGMNLYGKTVLSPDIINSDQVPVVIIAVPSHIGQISNQIVENHPRVLHTLDICELVGEDLPDRLDDLRPKRSPTISVTL